MNFASTKTLYIDFPPIASLEQFLRAIWGAIPGLQSSFSPQLNLTHNSQVMYPFFFFFFVNITFLLCKEFLLTFLGSHVYWQQSPKFFLRKSASLWFLKDNFKGVRILDCFFFLPTPLIFHFNLFFLTQFQRRSQM